MMIAVAEMVNRMRSNRLHEIDGSTPFTAFAVIVMKRVFFVIHSTTSSPVDHLVTTMETFLVFMGDVIGMMFYPLGHSSDAGLADAVDLCFVRFIF